MATLLSVAAPFFVPAMGAEQAQRVFSELPWVPS